MKVLTKALIVILMSILVGCGTTATLEQRAQRAANDLASMTCPPDWVEVSQPEIRMSAQKGSWEGRSTNTNTQFSQATTYGPRARQWDRGDSRRRRDYPPHTEQVRTTNSSSNRWSRQEEQAIAGRGMICQPKR